MPGHRHINPQSAASSVHGHFAAFVLPHLVWSVHSQDWGPSSLSIHTVLPASSAAMSCHRSSPAPGIFLCVATLQSAKHADFQQGDAPLDPSQQQHKGLQGGMRLPPHRPSAAALVCAAQQQHEGLQREMCMLVRRERMLEWRGHAVSSMQMPYWSLRMADSTNQLSWTYSVIAYF